MNLLGSVNLMEKVFNTLKEVPKARTLIAFPLPAWLWLFLFSLPKVMSGRTEIDSLFKIRSEEELCGY